MDLLKEIYLLHKKQLNHLSKKNKKVLICLSGIPCTGKTFIAKILEKKYGAVRLSSDNLRNLLQKLGKKHPRLLKEKTREEILEKYLVSLIQKPPFKNSLIILDRGIDRNYPSISSLAKKYNYDLFIIRVLASRKIAEKGVRKKLGNPDDNFISSIDRWVKEYKTFGKKQKHNITIKNDLNKNPNLSLLFKALDKIIN